jgi:drug/metabolite transporter (DMT)-like permease
MNRRRVQTILLIVPMLWGLVFVAVRETLEELSTVQIVTLRFAMIAAVVGGAMLVWPSLRAAFKRSNWGLLVFAGIMAVPLSNLAIVQAQNYLSPVLASLLITTSPAMAAVLAPWVLGERLTATKWIGFGVAFAGAAIVIVMGAGGDASFEISTIAGAAVGIITPLAWALYTLSLKKMTGDYSAFAAVGATVVVGSAFLIPFLPTAAEGAQTASMETWLWLIFLAFGGTLIPYLIWFWSMRYLDANETSAYLYLVPLFAMMWSVIVLREWPPLIALAGGALVLAGVALTQRTSPDPVSVPKEAV